jgi:hypothetical protein
MRRCTEEISKGLTQGESVSNLFAVEYGGGISDVVDIPDVLDSSNVVEIPDIPDARGTGEAFWGGETDKPFLFLTAVQLDFDLMEFI